MDGKPVFLACAFAAMLTAGCGQAKTAPGEEKPDTDANAAITMDASQMLVGTWYGRADLNREQLNRKLATISDPALRSDIQKKVQNFLTTEFGARFGSDGSMELDLKIQAAGQTFRDSTRGTWRTVEVMKNAVLLETTESLPGGGTETNRVRYQFEQNGDIAIMVAPTSEHLADCNPVFVFQRVQSTVGQSTMEIPAEIADRASDAIMK